MPNIGDQIQVNVTGGIPFAGQVKFATDTFVSVDQGDGVVAILKYDANTGKWRMGKSSVQFRTLSSFRAQLIATLRRVRREQGCCELCGQPVTACDCDR